MRGVFRSTSPIRAAPSPHTAGQPIEDALGDESGVHTVRRSGEPLDRPSPAGHQSNTKLNTVIGAFSDAPQQLTVKPLRQPLDRPRRARCL
jgi:hypothetical protein